MMNPKQFQEVGRIFQSVVELTAERRSAYLDEACGRDRGLRDALDRLLERDRAAGNFLEAPSSADAAGFLRTSRESALIGERIGAYTIRGVLGRGGMGVVYEAQQENPRRIVALKVVRAAPYLDDLTTRLIRREAQALARLDHPEIAAIHEAGAQDGLHYFAMECVHGLPLTQYARDRGLSLQERLRLFGTICDAVHYAHQRGVIHRDLKPSNILVTANGRPKVLDFGLARIIDPDAEVTTRATEPGAIMGTLAYMSPEQARGRSDDIDTRTDVYSLGVILYELLTDRPPFDLKGLALPEAARIICEQPPPTPGSVSRALRGDIETIVLKALQKEPQQRYQSAAALGEDVTRYLAGHPILARPLSTSYQLRKLVARHRIPAALLLALFVLLAGSTAWLTRLYSAASMAQTSEQESRLTAEEKTAVAYEIQQFLQNMLSSADPDQSRGREVTVREMLDRAADSVDSELTGDPAVEAEVRATIGRTYCGLGLYDQAETHLERALAITSQSQQGAVEIARRQFDLASLRQAQGRFHEAQALLDDALDAQRSVETAGADMASTLDLMGEVLIVREELDSAETAIGEALELRRAIYGERSWEVGRTLRALGQLASARGELQAAIPLLREALSVAEETLGEHREVANSLESLALTLRETTVDPEEVVRLHRRALEIRRNLLGDVHPDVARSLHQVANSLPEIFFVDRLAAPVKDLRREAEDLFNEALRIRVAAFGRNHQDVAETLACLGRLAAIRGRHEEAERLVGEAVEVQRAVYGSMHSRVAIGLNDLGHVLLSAGKREEAESAYRESLMIARSVQDEGNVALAYPLVDLANVVGRDRPEESAKLYREALALRVAAGDHWYTIRTRELLGNCLLRLSEFDEAEPLLLETYEALVRKHGDSSPESLPTVKRLVSLYENWHEVEPNQAHDAKAAEWQAKLQAASGSTTTPTAE